MLKFRFIERPTIATTLPFAVAASTTCCRRWMCDEKVVMITRPGACRMISRSDAPTVRSDAVDPGTSALVESAINSATPASPSAPSRPISVGLSSIGVGSSLKSPVCTIAPNSVWNATATASGTEWVTRMNSIVNGPTCTVPPSGLISTRSTCGDRPCSSSFDFTRPRVRRVPHTSAAVPISRSR